MNSTIQYVLVTLIAISFAAIVGIASSRYIAAQFDEARAPFEARA